MEQVEVEILGQVITAQYGTLSTGDILRTNAAFAKHLINDCSAAKYSKPVVSPPPIQLVPGGTAGVPATVAESLAAEAPPLAAPAVVVEPAAKPARTRK